jgi:hypothetical protein
VDAGVLEEAIDLERAIGRVPADTGQGIEFDLVFLQLPHLLHDALEGARAVAVLAVAVVDLLRAVQADADEKVVGLEELAPLVVEMQRVRLQGVPDLLAGAIRRLQLDHAAKEVDASRVGSPPCQTNSTTGVGCAATYCSI